MYLQTTNRFLNCITTVHIRDNRSEDSLYGFYGLLSEAVKVACKQNEITSSALLWSVIYID